MPYSINATIDSAGASSSGASISVSSTFAAGETPIVLIEWAANTGTVTPTDGTNDAKYAQIGSYVVATTGGPRTIGVFWAPGATPGTYTVLGTFNSNRLGRRIAVVKVSGLAGSGAVGAGQNQAAVSGTDALSSGNVTPPSQPALLLALCSTLTNASAVSAGTGFTGLGSLASWDAFGNNRSQLEHKRLTSTSAVAATATPAASDDGLSFAVVIPEASGAALAGSATDTSSGTGALSTGIPLAGTASDTAAGTGSLSTGIPLAGAAADAATGTGSLTTGIRLAGSAQDQAGGSGSLSTQINLQGGAADTSTATGSLSTGIPLSGQATDQAAGSGSLSTQIPLTGSAADTATGTAGLSTGIALAGAAADQSMGTGDLTQAAPTFQANGLVCHIDPRRARVVVLLRETHIRIKPRVTHARIKL
jgi:hypothetical protein